MIVRLQGGLGNQMFQYAFGRSVSMYRNTPLYFDRAAVDRCRDHRRYMMDAYDVRMEFITPPNGPVYQEKGMPYDANVLLTDPGSLFSGYWQTERYFIKDLVRKELSLPKGEPNEGTKRILQRIKDRVSPVAVHVRRGDYLRPGTKDFHGCFGAEYYKSGMNYFRELVHPTFFVFSDDPEWCRDTFYKSDVEIVQVNKSSELESAWDIYLMSQCNHALISNSSFGWWGAWLNPYEHKVVLAPKKWFQAPEMDDRDIVPQGWRKI
jgi:Glycosyl transferase family 11